MADSGGSSQMDSLLLSQRMEAGAGVRTSSAVGGGGAGSPSNGMLPFIEGKSLDHGFSAISGEISIAPAENMDAFFSKINQEAFMNQGISETLGKMANHLGTEEAKGSEIGDFQSGEKLQAPTVINEAGMKSVGMIGGDQGRGG